MAKVDIQMLRNRSDEVLDALEEAVQAALEEVGMQAQNYATAICPHQTGRLQGSITHATTRMASSVTKPATPSDGVTGAPDDRCVVIGTNVEYAAYVEHGAQGRDPQKYLEPAVMDHRAEWRDIFDEHLRNA